MHQPTNQSALTLSSCPDSVRPDIKAVIDGAMDKLMEV
jgi:hypothetical protein